MDSTLLFTTEAQFNKFMREMEKLEQRGSTFIQTYWKRYVPSFLASCNWYESLSLSYLWTPSQDELVAAKRCLNVLQETYKHVQACSGKPNSNDDAMYAVLTALFRDMSYDSTKDSDVRQFTIDMFVKQSEPLQVALETHNKEGSVHTFVSTVYLEYVKKNTVSLAASWNTIDVWSLI